MCIDLHFEAISSLCAAPGFLENRSTKSRFCDRPGDSGSTPAQASARKHGREPGITCKPSNFRNVPRVTDVMFCFRALVVMIRLAARVRLELKTTLGAGMDRRKQRRLKLELPVRIWGVDRMARPFAEIVRVRNVSDGGAVLTGVRSKVQTGELLDVQLGASRAQFRIVWMSLFGEAGIQALEFEPPILGVGLPRLFEMVGTG